MRRDDRRDSWFDRLFSLAAGAILLLGTDSSEAELPALERMTPPAILSTHLLEDAALPLPDSARPESHALGFRMGGISDLVALTGRGDRTELWGVTDRGPNGMVPKPGSDGGQIGRAHV